MGFRDREVMRDTHGLLTLACFLAVNMVPVHIFASVICVDYCWLSSRMSDEFRLTWLTGMYFFTWAFVALYALNVVRLVCVLVWNVQTWFVDWEGTLFNRIYGPFFRVLKWGSDTLWESYHNRTWSYIRGIQAESKEKKEIIRRLAEREGLPDIVQDIITDMVCLKGAEELDYRWYMHDNRHNMRLLKGMKYDTRECITSFLVPNSALSMNKDAIVSEYCFKAEE